MNKSIKYMMTAIIIFYCTNSFSQVDNKLEGIYSFETIGMGVRTLVSMKLLPNGHFEYSFKQGMISYQHVEGNWQQRGNKLILDSYPQRDRMIVEEDYKRMKGTVIHVLNKKMDKINYSLKIVTIDNDTITLTDRETLPLVFNEWAFVQRL